MNINWDIKKIPKSFWYSLFVICVINGLLGYWMISGRIFSDYPAHIDILNFYLENGKFPYPPLYYAAFGFFDWILPIEKSFEIGLLIIVILGWGWKYILTYKYFNQKGRVEVWLPWLPVAFLFLFPVTIPWIEKSYFLGKFSPNVWHNGSSVLMWPFCFLLFTNTLDYLKGESSSIWAIVIYSLIILLIKPSYLFGYVPGILTAMAIGKYSTRTWRVLIYYVTFILMLLWLSKLLIFDGSDPSSIFYNFNSKGGVSIDPLGVWFEFSENLGWDLLSSFLLPMLIIVFYWQKLKIQKDFQLSAIVFLFSMIVFFSFSEKGPGYLHGNFYWQIPVSLFLFLLVMIKHVPEIWKDEEKKVLSRFIKKNLVCMVFLIQVLSGIYYLFHFSYSGYFF
jgi:hypothetical protein